MVKKELKFTIEEFEILKRKYKEAGKNISKVYKLENMREELRKFLEDE